jgi:mono/diheme cytochrome c family protein
MRLPQISVNVILCLLTTIAPACSSPSGAAQSPTPIAAPQAQTTAPQPVARPAPAAQSPAPPTSTSTISGVYSDAQANRGKTAWQSICASCHTTAEHSDSKFAGEWSGRSLLDFYVSLYTTMPKDDPGTLSEEQYMDIIAYMLKLNGMRAGAAELVPDTTALKAIKMEFKPHTAP